MVMKNSKNKGEKEGKQKIIQSKETKLDQKGLGSQKKSLLQTFWIAFYFKDTEILIYHARFCSKNLLDSIFVGFSELITTVM